MNKIIKTLLILLLLANVASAKSALDPGIAGVGARPMGMGRSFVAVSDDVNALFLNPAGMAFQRSWGVTSMSTRLLNRVDYKMAGGLYSTDYGTFGLGFIALTTPAGYLTTDRSSLASATPISYGSSIMILSYAYDFNRQIYTRRLGHLAVGGNLKFINNKFEGVDNAQGKGMEADLALMFIPREGLTLGANLQNMLLVSDGGKVNWGSGTAQNVPANLKLGAAYQVKPNLLLSLDSDINVNGNRPVLLHAGTEWKPFSLLAIRAGIDQDLAGTQTVNNLTAGISLKVQGFSFDYAYRQDSTQAELSNHYFSLSFSPEPGMKFVEGEKKEIPEIKRANQDLSYEELMARYYRTEEKK